MMRRIIWNSWKSIGKLKNMKNQSFEVLFHKQIRNARRGSKEKSAIKHSWWQSCQPLLEHFLKSNLCMLYVVLKLRKSKIQGFKRYTIWSWNEGVTAIASRSLQAEGRILHSAAKSPFCCEMISQPFCTVLCFPPEVSLHDGRRIPQDERSLRSVAKLAVCCEMISQSFLCLCEISQTSFALVKWSLVRPDICYRHLEIFLIRFLLSKSQNSPCKPPIISFLSF